MVPALLRSITIVALAAVVLGGTGCRIAEKPAASPNSAATGSAEASGAASGSADETRALEPLRQGDAEALEKELDAIERELDSLVLPDDSDFEDIEGAL